MCALLSSPTIFPELPARNHSPLLRRLTFPALGTTCEVQYAAPAGEVRAAAFEQAAVSWVSAFEAKYSRFIPTSLVSRINAAAGFSWIAVDEETDRLLELCETLFNLTQGVLDPTALPLIRLWNWKDPNPSIPSAGEIEAAKLLVGWTKVRRSRGRIFLPTPGMALDFGGFGKEYAVDIVAQIAFDHGITNALVDFGHDLRVLGAPPGRPAWHIGLEDPRNQEAPPPVLRLPAAGASHRRGTIFAASKSTVVATVISSIRARDGPWPTAASKPPSSPIPAFRRACSQPPRLSSVFGKAWNASSPIPGAEGLLITDNSRAQTRGFYRYATA